VIIEDPAFHHRVAWDLYMAVIAASSSCRIGAAALGPKGEAPAWEAALADLGFTVRRTEHVLTTPTIRAIGGVGMYDEIELVAREMLALLRSGVAVHDRESGVRRPIRPGDLLGVAPNSEYLRLLNDACCRLGIPVASPRRRDTADVPLVRALLETFRLLADAGEDTPERGLTLLATPYVGLSLDDHDQLARTLVRRGLGSLRSWHRVAADSHSRKFVALAKNVARLTTDLEGERSPKELAAVLTSFGLEFGFLSAGRRFNLAAGRDDALRLDQQGWESLTGAATELNDALLRMGVSRISARQWMRELSELVAGSTVRVDARALDGVHLTIAGAGMSSAPHVFAVGWREGLFPRRTREDPLLPDRVKKTLNEHGAMFALSADHPAQESARRERIRRGAQESLTLSCPSTAEDGDRLLPSFYMEDLGAPELIERSVGDPTWPLALAASRGERLTRATLVARHRRADIAGEELDAVREVLSGMTDGERRAYDGLLHATEVIALPPEILAECAPLAAKMSASQAQKVAHCLYEHFGKRRLKLESLESPPLDRRLLGTIAHGVLSETGRGGFDSAMLDRVLARWWNDKVPPELRDEPQSEFELEILLADLTTLLDHERAHFAASGSRAAYFELSFGTNDAGRDPSSLAEGLEVELPAGAPIERSTLRGAIDRVDVIERDGKRFGIAIDYKSGKGESHRDDMEDMADFQLPIYCELLPRFGVEPVGAVYLGISSGDRYGVVRSDFADAFIPAGSKGVRSLPPEEFAAFMRARQDALRGQIARLARGELAVRPRNDDCGFCDLRAVCRIGTFGVGGGRAED
jgi:hypothetical protein